MRLSVDVWIDGDTHIDNLVDPPEGWLNLFEDEDGEDVHGCDATLFFDDANPRETADKIGELIGALKEQQARQVTLWEAELAREEGKA